MSAQNDSYSNRSSEVDAIDRNEKYITFIRKATYGPTDVFFMTDEPAHVGGYAWLRSYSGASPLGELQKAYERGIKVQVTLDFPFHPGPDGRPSATVTWATTEFQPTARLS